MRRMLLAALVTTTLCGGACIRPSSVSCDEGLVCPDGTVCATVTPAAGEGPHLCVTPEQLVACVDKQESESCLAGFEQARCYDGVCLPSGCGNGRVDVADGEVCDDGNANIGDGCSAGCRSTETCGNGVIDPFVMGRDPPSEECDDGNLASHDGCSPTCEPEQPRWIQLQLGRPLATEDVAMAYDHARDQILLFGALPAPSSDGGTWVWDGEGWNRRSLAFEPRPRTLAMIAYDPRRERVVLFGGRRRSGIPLDDTIEWDGTRWVNVFASGPLKRAAGAMTYDARRGRVILHGGHLENAGSTVVLANDTWEWDGTTWTDTTTALGPPALDAVKLAFDPARGRSVLVGRDPAGTVVQTWEYDGSWSRIVGGALPPPTDGSSLAYDVERAQVIRFGGVVIATGLRTADTWAWNGATWTNLGASLLPPRSGHAVATDPIRRRQLIFGGTEAGGAVDATDVWSGGASRRLTVETPRGDSNRFAAFAFDPVRGRAVLSGEEAVTWELRGTGWRRAAATSPAGRLSPVTVYDERRGAALMFGGAVGTTVTNETWTFDGTTWRDVMPVDRPGARMAHAMTYRRATDEVVMVGGACTFAGTLCVDGTWSWNGTTWTQLLPQAQSPPPRRGHAMAYDPIRDRVLLFGGQTALTAPGLPETWEFDGATWQLLPSGTGPIGRASTAMVWNPTRRKILLFGGRTGGGGSSLADTWEWDGDSRTWRVLDLPFAPPERFAHMIAPSSDGTGVWIFGGLGDDNPNTDLWLLRWEGRAPVEVCRLDRDTDEDLDGGCADLDCWSTCTPLCPPGVSCAMSAPGCGDGTCSATLENCIVCPSDCGACLPTCGDYRCDPGETPLSCPGDC